MKLKSRLKNLKERFRPIVERILLKIRKILKAALPIIFSFFVGVYLLQIPTYHGDINISRPDLGKITIKRDDFGIPHIQGRDIKAAIYGLGFVHGQDRIFSMTLRKLTYEGKLSSYMGEKALSMDLLFRSLELKEIAQKAFENSPQETKDLLQAYSDGVNDAVSKMKMLPIEFWLCSIPYRKWTPQDTLGVVRLLSFGMSLGKKEKKL